jgi:hypothetical protein
MKNVKKNGEYVDKLYEGMLKHYSYITIDKSVAERFVATMGVIKDYDRALDLLRDFVLSQDLAEDVVE